MICFVQIEPPGIQVRNYTDLDEELLTQTWLVGSMGYRLKFFLPLCDASPAMFAILVLMTIKLIVF